MQWAHLLTIAFEKEGGRRKEKTDVEGKKKSLDGGG